MTDNIERLCRKYIDASIDTSDLTEQDVDELTRYFAEKVKEQMLKHEMEIIYGFGTSQPIGVLKVTGKHD